MHVRDPTLTVPQNSGKVAGSVRGAEWSPAATLARSCALCWTWEYGASWLRGPPEGPKGFHQDARRPSRSFADVALALTFSYSPCRHAFCILGESAVHSTEYATGPYKN